MATIYVDVTDTFDDWRVKTNEIGEAIGDADLLANPGISIAGTAYTNVVACIDALKDGGNIQSDWDQSDTTEDDFINNKPAVKQADWNENDTTDAGFINNRPLFALDSDLSSLASTVGGHTNLIGVATAGSESGLHLAVKNVEDDISYINNTVLPDMATAHSGDIDDVQLAIQAVTIEVFNVGGSKVHP